ncbi:MAG: ABC transporter ATP-binding protein [Anaerolineales bacterium]|nr:ABC transporter ATP-binding protein [Anaerolineales bacterium]MCS7246919.1 ABC transporter ATP-binding protein [Anaerolineales bacterium]MDW8160730.1 ABC transporter ATP-binding protein [Anaerolineales bacterium]MDW8448044.1 ABC transporter ATP-binding protein [Anaerolineales bacterium]
MLGGLAQSNACACASESSLISLNGVSKIYHTDAGRFVALDNVNLQIQRGEFVAIVGKSGSGKTTLINLITGIDRPTKGEVCVDQVAVHRLKESEKALWRGVTIGVVFQFFQLLPTLTVIENVMLPMCLCNLYSGSERLERAYQLLRLVQMEHQAHKLPSFLSGGEQQRVAIARALANDPPIVATDEPTGNLDSRTAASIMELFEDLVRNGKTLLMVTHDPDLAARAQRTIALADGRIIQA